MGIEIKDINKFLEDLSEYRLKQKYNQVLKQTPENYYEEKLQGDTSESVEVYKLGVEDLHLRITRTSDSYGENEDISQIKFVKPVIKTIEDFE